MEARNCDRYVRILLDGQKTGAHLPADAAKLLKEVVRPHYMLSNEERKANGKNFHSVSVAGELFDMATAQETVLKSETAAAVRLDPDLVTLWDFDCEYCFTGGREREEWKEEIEEWARNCQRYCKETSEILNSKSPVRSEQEKNQAIEAISQRYVEQFEWWAEELVKRAKTAPEHSIKSKLTVRSLSRRCLACITYIVTYAKSHISLFCWQVCKDELLALKLENVKISLGYNPRAILPPSCLLSPARWFQQEIP